MAAPIETDPQTLALLRGEVKRDPHDPRALGKVDAPIVMVSYEDFSCPICATYERSVFPQLLPLVEAGTVRMEWRDLVVFPNYGSHLAAIGSRAAANQGKFWEYIKATYGATLPNQHTGYTEESVLKFAQAAGVPDLAKFETDFTSPELLNAVQEETSHAADDLGIEGTPAFIINDSIVGGLYPVEYFLETIAEQKSRG